MTLPPFSPEQLQRIIERLTAVLDEECGDDLAGWGASSLILLTIIIDMSGADRQEIADHILQPNKYREFLQ